MSEGNGWLDPGQHENLFSVLRWCPECEENTVQQVYRVEKEGDKEVQYGICLQCNCEVVHKVDLPRRNLFLQGGEGNQ